MNGPRFMDTNILHYSISRDPAEASNRDIAIALLDAENITLTIRRRQDILDVRGCHRALMGNGSLLVGNFHLTSCGSISNQSSSNAEL
jgi:hypothetical protein